MLLHKKFISILLGVIIITSSLMVSRVNADMVNGWNQSGQTWEYYKDGILQRNIWAQDTANRWYYLDENGVMRTNDWAQDSSERWYYLDEYGAMKTDQWVQDTSKRWYYLGSTGTIKTNSWIQDKENQWYHLDENGVKEINTWIQDSSERWYYLDDNGIMITNGWAQDSLERWYYLNSNGRISTGWINYGQKWYYLNDDGIWLSDESFESTVNENGMSSSTDYAITIDSKRQMVNIFSGYAEHWKLIRSMRCATGKASTPTVKGFYKIQCKGSMFRVSKNTICKYYSGFHGDYLFHTVLLDNNGNIQVPTLGVAVSHGCVRLAIEDAKFIYDNIPIGTKVWSY